MEIYVHPTCLSSYKLIKKLRADGFLEGDNVKIIDTSRAVYESLEKGVISVPYVLNGDEPLAVDPVSPEEVESLIAGRPLDSTVQPMKLQDALENFSRSVMASAFAVSSALLMGGYEHLAKGKFLIASTKIAIYPHDFTLREVREAIETSGPRLFEEKSGLYVRALAYNLVRHAFWAGKGPDLQKEEIAELIMAKASLGRVGIPYPVSVDRELIDSVQSVLKKKGEEYLNRIRSERDTIEGDREYLSFLSSRASV